jgi:hypothetical protein
MSPHDDERAAREAGPLTIDSDPNAPPPYAIQIHGEDGRWTTRIHGDGRVEFGEGVEPGEQGRRFWTAMSEDMAGVIEAARQAGRAEALAEREGGQVERGRSAPRRRPRQGEPMTPEQAREQIDQWMLTSDDPGGDRLLAILTALATSARAEGQASMRERAAEAVQARAALMRAAADEHQPQAAQTAWELRMVAGKLDSVARDLAALPITGERT